MTRIFRCGKCHELRESSQNTIPRSSKIGKEIIEQGYRDLQTIAAALLEEEAGVPGHLRR